MPDIGERLRDWQDYEPMKQFCADAIPDLLEAANEIERLRASDTAWKIIAKQNDTWNALPQSKKEETWREALDAEVAASIAKDDEIERLRTQDFEMRIALDKDISKWSLDTLVSMAKYLLDRVYSKGASDGTVARFLDGFRKLIAEIEKGHRD